MRVNPDLVADLGFDPAAAEAVDFTPPGQTYPDPPVLQVGSIPARALHSICSGTPVTVIDSPPGGGKTHSVLSIVAHLANTVGLNVAIGCPTGEQAINVGNRLVEYLHPTQIDFRLADCPPDLLHPNLRPGAKLTKPDPGPTPRGTVMVRTLMSLAMTRVLTSAAPDVLVVDEAYQATFTDAAAAAAHATQVLLVGDPGQIGPVVTVNTSRWTGRFAPHLRAPEAFAHHGGTHLSIDVTYRLGRVTADLLAPLYDFPFTSARPPRHVAFGEAPLGEIEQVAVPGPVPAPTDQALMAAAVTRVEHLVRAGRYVSADGDRELSQADVVVIAALNAQVVALSALLHERGLDGVKVGTADKLQGGQWPAVVAVDPTCSGSTSGHTLSLGRLCVMLSRHMAHLTWVHDGAWRALDEETGLARTIRTAMLG